MNWFADTFQDTKIASRISSNIYGKWVMRYCFYYFLEKDISIDWEKRAVNFF